jgi:hypothetical protein
MNVAGPAFQADAVGPWIVKRPIAELDYAIDWTDWLEGDTIATSQWSVASGLTLITQTQVAGRCTAWLKDGVAGTEYTVTNTITTNNATPRKESQSFRVMVI